MATKEDTDELLKRLLAIFQVEAGEHLKAMSSLLHALQQPASPDAQPQLVESLFREAHSLKGAARSVNMSAVEAVCKELESVLARLKQGESGTPGPGWFEAVYGAVDALAGMVEAGAAGRPVPGVAEVGRIVRPLQALELAAAPAVAAPAPAHAEAAAVAVEAPVVAALEASVAALPERPAITLPGTGETVRIHTARLAGLLARVEGLLAFKFSTAHLVGELHALAADLAQWEKAWRRSARLVRLARAQHGNAAADRSRPEIDKLLDAVEHNELSAKSFSERLAALEHLGERERRALSGMVDSLQNDMRQALMQPFASLLELLPKLARDLARDSGKEVELHLEGAAIEIDRRIMEQMKDPLIHLLRNAIDHGIETAADRRRAGKPAAGRIVVGITPLEGNRVELTVADDGAGVDLDRLRTTAARLGIGAAEDLSGWSVADTLALMFESGLSTSPILTELSGRGLGLAIVREKVERLGGSVSAELPAAGGTRFRIVLPTSLATFRGLLVAVGDRQFVLPSSGVERVLRVEAAGVRTVENREAVEVGGQAVALVRLADVLGVRAAAPEPAILHLAVVEGGGRRIAFAVDAVLGDQEVLVKGLGPQLRRVPNVAGATLLGPGRVVPVLNVADLLVSAQQLRLQAGAPAVPAAAPRQQSVLVAEDSLTARLLLKNILESAGFRVETAVDGMDALTTLRNGQFDLVVSDVEMPRLDGFDLTARIRADKKLADLPVVLVTALESREHKERGIEVGANAYIVKSSFDQSNLFEVIGRLI